MCIENLGYYTFIFTIHLFWRLLTFCKLPEKSRLTTTEGLFDCGYTILMAEMYRLVGQALFTLCFEFSLALRLLCADAAVGGPAFSWAAVVVASLEW